MEFIDSRRIKAPALILAGLLALVSHSALAGEGRVSGTVLDAANGEGLDEVVITVAERGNPGFARTGITDASGRYSVAVPSPGIYTFQALKMGYGTVASDDLIILSANSQEQTVGVSMSEREWLKANPEDSASNLSWETGANRSYLIPALEIPAFLILLNGVARVAYPNLREDGKKVYFSTPESFSEHVRRGPWGLDKDDFSTNQFMHPYQGSMYHGFARSTGLSFWEAFVYTNAGSYLWETAGETTHPSTNDQISSGIAGSFFGEALFRMASTVLEDESGRPGFFTELGAALISPPVGLNRLAFGDRFKPVFPSRDPARFWRFRIGASLGSDFHDQRGPRTFNRNEAMADFSMAYGLPGKPGYRYTRPFDYFHFEFTTRAQQDNRFENVMIRGLLFGTDYASGRSFRGVGGIYAGYDYISPEVFRVSSTSASLGTTFQWWLLRKLALQGSVLGGVGYAAAGNVRAVGERDYHFGIAPQGLVALRLILGERAMLDSTGRAYHLTGTGGGDPKGRESIGRVNAGLTVRVYGRHALGLIYNTSRRDAKYSDREDSHQTVESVGILYTLLADTRFGAVEWRTPETQ